MRTTATIVDASFATPTLTPLVAPASHWTRDRRERRLGKALPYGSWLDVIRSHAAVDPARVALHFLPDLKTETVRWTCAELEQRMLAVAARLQRLEATGQRALLLLENSPDYIATFLGCIASGTVAVTLHPPSKQKHLERIAHVARDCGATVILSTRALHRRFHASIDELPELRDATWLLVDEVDADEAERWRAWSPPADAVAFLQYTSGSTGSPRGVVVTNEDLILQAEMFQECVALTRDDRMLSWLPIFHDMGLMFGSLQALYTGFPLYLSTPLAAVKYPDRWIRQLGELGCTLSAGPNFMFELVNQVVSAEDLAGVDLSGVRCMLCAAEPLRARTIRTFNDKLAPFGFSDRVVHPGYGLAEATLGVSFRSLSAPITFLDVSASALRDGSLRSASDDETELTLVGSGKAFPGVRLYVADPTTGEPVPPNTIGEIFVDTPGMPHGYWNAPDATAAVFTARLDGTDVPLLRTGDLGFLDPTGELFITGRRKELIIVAGKNHYPSDIEQTAEDASEHVRTNYCAAFSADVASGEVAVLVVELARSTRAEDLDPVVEGRSIRRQVAGNHELRVHQVLFLAPGQLPKTTSGKIQRTLARLRWLAGDFDVVGQG